MPPSDWIIEKLVPGGEGMARLADGRVGFAWGVVPGDKIRPEILEERSSFLRAKRHLLVEAGRDRVQAPCAVHGRCGGCDWMQLAPEQQRHAKLSLVREALLRTGGFTPATLPKLELERAGSDLGYRARVQLQVGPRGELGFFAARTHELVEISSCVVCDPRLQPLFTCLRETGTAAEWAQFERLELRVADAAPYLLVRAQPRLPRSRNRRAAAARAAKLEPLFARLASKLLAAGVTLVLAGSDRDSTLDQRWELADDLFLAAPAAAFTQVNWSVNRALIERVVQGASQRGLSRFLDLYCGAGNFSFPLARAGLSGVGVEVSRGAIQAAERNLAALRSRASALQSAQAPAWELRFVAGDVGPGLQELGDSRGFDLVLLDPPRSGAAAILPQIAERIGAGAGPSPRYLCMCSCDPVTLARDLKQLTTLGFLIEELRAFDMFPHTHHVELLAWLVAPAA